MARPLALGIETSGDASPSEDHVMESAVLQHLAAAPSIVSTTEDESFRKGFLELNAVETATAAGVGSLTFAGEEFNELDRIFRGGAKVCRVTASNRRCRRIATTPTSLRATEC